MAWYRSTTNPTGVTNMDTPANALSRLNAFFTECAAEGASFLWTVASYQSTSPRYLVLKRKSGAAGRLMLFGGDNPNAAALGPSVSSNNSVLYCGYSRTATSDTPTTAYTAGAPYADWFLASGCAFLSPTSSQLRAYCNPDNDTLFWVFSQDTDIFGHFTVGSFLRNESGTACVGLCNSGTASGSAVLRPFFQTGSAVTAASAAGTVAFCQVYDPVAATTVRLASPGLYVSEATQVAQNERFISLTGVAKFLPYVGVVLNGGPTPENRFYTVSRIGYGPMKTRGFQWTDAAANPKGYYIGYINNTTDVTAFNLLDDTF